MLEARQRPLLVVEDSDEDFDTVREASQAAGLTNQIYRAPTGEVCLSLLRAGTFRPSVVLLDLNTPGLDGRDTLNEIKRDPALRELPVIVVTTSANPRDVESCYRAGANAYHVKPVRYADHLQVLISLFRYWLGCVVLPGSEKLMDEEAL